MNPSKHIFSKRPTRAKTIESIAFWLFRLATYFLIICAGYIFLDISYNGAQTVFKSSAPFVNVDFLTKAPQTLHVFEPKEIVYEMDRLNAKEITLKSDLRNLSNTDIEGAVAIRAEIEEVQAKYAALDEQRVEERRMYGDEDFRQLAEEPSRAIYKYSTYSYSGGGIGPTIVGTLFLVLGSVTIALTLGLLCAVYLSEYSKPGPVLQMIRLSVLNLSGVPSIVFGLFGFGMFVMFFGWGKSLLAGCFTLAFMALPLIIAACEESMKAIPKGFREGSLALGATKWTMIRTNVMPYALPGILTSCVMGIVRVAGETAPIMFTAAFAMRGQLPWEGLEHWYDFFFQGVMAMPYHIYVVSAKIPQNEYTHSMQYGAAFVFLLIIGSMAFASIVMRARVRGRLKW